MNFSVIKELLEQIERTDHGKMGSKIAPIVEQMQLMVGLLEDYSLATEESDRKALMNSIMACRIKSQKALQTLLAEQGTSMEQVMEFFTNPAHFKKEEWETIQMMQGKIASAVGQE
jgi:prophage DNA circulation protein